MVYYDDNDLIIRNMEEADARILTDEEIAQGWDADISKYQIRLKDQAEGKCVSLTAVYKGCPAGYVNVYITGQGGAFSGKRLPEIVDFGVLEKYRRKGIGSKLMDAAEQIAGQYADTVWLGVGLHSGYGSAQRMYIKRGYIPDGTGVWYQNKPCEQYEQKSQTMTIWFFFCLRGLIMGEKDNHCFRVLIDADACPVYRIAEWEAKERNIAVILFGDTNHFLTSDYSEIRVIGAGADAVDFALVNACNTGDIVITQDYGVAAMVLSKGAYAIHQSGRWYTNENIDRMLMERHLAKKARMGNGKHHLKGPAKRTTKDDIRFAESFTKLLDKRIMEEHAGE